MYGNDHIHRRSRGDTIIPKFVFINYTKHKIWHGNSGKILTR